MTTKVRLLTRPVLNSCERVQPNVEWFRVTPLAREYTPVKTMTTRCLSVSRDRNRFSLVATAFDACISTCYIVSRQQGRLHVALF